MEKQKKKQNGITLIALVISIIVMLILAGVSLNMTVGDNGIISQAQAANYAQSCAMLEEYLQQYYVQNFEKMESTDGSKVVILQTMKPGWFYSTRLGYIPDSNGNALYLINKDGLPNDIKKELKGGDAGDGTYSSYAKLIDVYGVTSDLHVYYSSNGVDTMIGVSSDKLDQDDATRSVASTATGSMGASLLAFDNDGDGKISAQEARTVKDANIDASNMTTLEELGSLSSLKTLVLRNATLDSLSGIERCPDLYYIYFQNCTIGDYTALTELRNQLTHLIFYSINDTELATICSYAKGIGDEGKGDSTRNFSKLTNFAVVGCVDTEDMFSTATPGGRGTNNYMDSATKSTKTITSVANLDKLSTATKNKITYLSIRNNNISSLSGIGNFSNLVCLRTEYNTLTSLAGIESLSHLEYINAQSNSLTSLYTVRNTNNLKYLIINTNRLTSLAGLENASNLSQLYAYGNLFGKDIETTTKANTDSMKAISGKTNMSILDLRNNTTLKWIDYISTDTGIRYLQLSGNTGMDATSFGGIRNIINLCEYVNYPDSYALSLIDPSTTNLDLKNRTMTVSVFESLMPTFEANGTTPKSGLHSIKKLDLYNINLTTDSGTKLTATEANSEINKVLESLKTLNYLRVGADNTTYSSSSLSTIGFIASGKVTGLIELDLINVNVTDLSNMNNYATSIRTLYLNISNSAFSFSNSQTMLNNLYNNSMTYGGLVSKFYGYNAGLVIRNSNLSSKLAGLSSVIGFYIYSNSGLGFENVVVDLSGCTSLKYISGYRSFTNCTNLILPQSLESYDITYNVCKSWDFSRCYKLSKINFADCSLGDTFSYEAAKKAFQSIGTMYANAKTAGITPQLNSIRIENVNRTLPDFDFLSYVKDSPITSVEVVNSFVGRKTLNNIDGLKYLTNLQSLTLNDCLFTDVSPLIPVYDTDGKLVSGCPNLSYLSFYRDENLTDIGKLGKLSSLVTCSVSNCRIVNIYGIQEGTTISYLSLTNNCLYNISSYIDSTGKSVNYNVLSLLAGMNVNKNGALNRLYLAGNSIEDVSILQSTDLSWTGKDIF